MSEKQTTYAITRTPSLSWSDNVPCSPVDPECMELLPAGWTNATPYAKFYGALGYHTGVDMNLNTPTWDLDRNAPVYSVLPGTCIFAGKARGKSWGGLIVVLHRWNDFVFCTRYGHVSINSIAPSVGEQIKRGEQIARIGLCGGANPNYHLHFDIGKNDLLLRDPASWETKTAEIVKENYHDPFWLYAHKYAKTETQK